MKTDIKNIELIHKYLNKELTSLEFQTFETRLQSDQAFQALYDEQIAIVEGIKRAGLKEDIAIAKRSYHQTKWLNTIGILSISIATLFIVWNIWLNKPNIESVPIQTETKTTIEKEREAIDKVVDKEEANQIVEQSKALEITESEEISAKTTNTVVTKNTEEIKEKPEQTAAINLTDSITEFNSNLVKTTVLESLKSLFEQVKKKPQIIEVNAEEETSFTLTEGTKITIPKHAFLDEKTNKLVRGNIQFEVTEYYQLADMLLGNLTTTSNGDPLETGGMLYLKATKKGEELKLKRNINIEFPFSTAKPDMQLFSGNQTDDAINWIPQGNRTLNVISFGTGDEHVEVPFDLVENVPVFPGCQGENQELKDCFNAKMKEFLIQNFNLEIAEDLNLTGKNRINTFFKINEFGNITNVRIRASSVTLGKEMDRVIQLLPKFQPALQRGRAVMVPYFLPFEFDFPGRDRNLPMVTIGSADVFEAELSSPRDSVKSDPTNYNAYRASAYAFSSANLGWINCDRFERGWKNKIRYKFKVKNSKGTNIKMVFKSMSAILPSKTVNEEVTFGLVPKDEEVVLVAIKKENDIFYLGIKETQIQDISELEFDFKSVTIEELKEEMIKLNSFF